MAQSFLISVNDLPQHTRTWSSNIFADDNAIYTTGKSFMETQCALQSSLYDAGRWFNNNNLPINIKKTICMLIAIESSPNRNALEERTLSLAPNSWTVSYHPVAWPSTRWQAAVWGTCSKVMLEFFFETCSSRQTVQSIKQKWLCKQYITCIQPCIDYVSAQASCSEQTKGLAI